jgi:4'-phosphopantetheinyl transferase EntD
MAGTPRALAWRRGRAALKRLLRQLGGDDDTAALHFPHPCLSLTHSRGVALAVHVANAGGTGVDLECRRLGRHRAARWLAAAGLFVTRDEQAWLSRLPPTTLGAELIRLWTVKEALFKADLNNAGLGLADYALANADHRAGHAALAADRRRTFRYATLVWDGAALSVAVRAEAEDDHADR